jgi:hypothetical protein
MKHGLAAILCLALVLPNTAPAQQASAPATKEDVQQLFSLMQQREMAGTIVQVMKNQVPALTESVLADEFPEATPQQQAQLKRFVQAETEKMLASMPFDELIQVMIPVYQRHFDHAEMQELIRFYSSPAGKKLLAEMPAIMSEYMEVATPIMQKWMERSMANIKDSAAIYARKLRQKSASPTSQKNVQ